MATAALTQSDILSMCRKCFPWLTSPRSDTTHLPSTAQLHPLSSYEKIAHCLTAEGRCVQSRASYLPKLQLMDEEVFFKMIYTFTLEDVVANHWTSFIVWRSLLKQDALLFIEPAWWPQSVGIHLDVQTFMMSFVRKPRWESMMRNSSLGCTLHGGSVPNLLPPPRPEAPGALKKRLSMDVLRGWAPDLGSLSMGLNMNLSPVKWPSLVTVCKWKQTLSEKLTKRHCGTEDESQVREQRDWTTSLCWKVWMISTFVAPFFQPFSLLIWHIGCSLYTAV